jgi:hypothetical protein
MKRFLPKAKKIFITIIQIPPNIILTVLYIILIFPYYLFGKKASKLQDYQPSSASYWTDISQTEQTIDTLRRQF